MQKIQCCITGDTQWFNMVNMPDFQNAEEAQAWLDIRKATAVADILTFRIVDALTPPTGPAPEQTNGRDDVEMDWNTVSDADKKNYRMGHFYFTHGKTLQQCHNDFTKAGWLAAQKAYEKQNAS